MHINAYNNMEVYVIIYMFQLTIDNEGENPYRISLIYAKNVYWKRYPYKLNYF